MNSAFTTRYLTCFVAPLVRTAFIFSSFGPMTYYGMNVGHSDCLKVRIKSLPTYVYYEADKFLDRPDDLAKTGNILCKDSQQRLLNAGIFICNALFDARFACDALGPSPGQVLSANSAYKF